MVSLVRQRFFQGRKRYDPSHSANDLGDYRIFRVSHGKSLFSAVSQNRYTFGVDRSAMEQQDEGYAGGPAR